MILHLGVVDIEVMEPIVENVFRQPFQLTDFLWVWGLFGVQVFLPIPAGRQFKQDIVIILGLRKILLIKFAYFV